MENVEVRVGGIDGGDSSAMAVQSKNFEFRLTFRFVSFMIVT